MRNPIWRFLIVMACNCAQKYALFPYYNERRAPFRVQKAFFFEKKTFFEKKMPKGNGVSKRFATFVPLSHQVVRLLVTTNNKTSYHNGRNKIPY